MPPQGNYAFDLIVEVGLARFRQHRQNGEIQAELRTRYGLRLPFSTINELAHTFLDCLAATHQARVPQLRKRLGGRRRVRAARGRHLRTGHRHGVQCRGGQSRLELGGRQDEWRRRQADRRPAATLRGVFRHAAGGGAGPQSPDRVRRGRRPCAEVLDLVCHYHFLENVGRQTVREAARETHGGTASLEDSSRPAVRLRNDLVRYSKQTGCLSAEQGRTMPAIAATLGRPGAACQRDGW